MGAWQSSTCCKSDSDASGNKVEDKDYIAEKQENTMLGCKEVRYSCNNYVEYHVGQSNVILSVPHGGSLKPAAIPDRDAGSLVDGQCVYDHKYNSSKDPDRYPVRYKKDMNTIELAEGIADVLFKLSGKILFDNNNNSKNHRCTQK